jgi:hypothetical protein
VIEEGLALKELFELALERGDAETAFALWRRRAAILTALGGRGGASGSCSSWRSSARRAKPCW